MEITLINEATQSGLILEKIENNDNVIKKTLMDLGNIIDGTFTFGTGITALLPAVKQLLGGDYPTLTNTDINLLYITAVWMLVNKNKDKVIKLHSIIKEKGLSTALKKVYNFLKTTEDIAIRVAGSLGYAANSLTDVVAFTFIAFPILDGLLFLINQGLVTLAEPSGYLKSVLFGVGILGFKNVFNHIIKKLGGELKKLKPENELPNVHPPNVEDYNGIVDDGGDVLREEGQPNEKKLNPILKHGDIIRVIDAPNRGFGDERATRTERENYAFGQPKLFTPYWVWHPSYGTPKREGDYIIIPTEEVEDLKQKGHLQTVGGNEGLPGHLHRKLKVLSRSRNHQWLKVELSDEEKEKNNISGEFDDTLLESLTSKNLNENTTLQDETIEMVNDIMGIIESTVTDENQKTFYLPEEIKDDMTYDVLGTDVTIEFTLSRNTELTDEFELEADYVKSEDVIEILLEINPFKEPENYTHIYYYLVEYVRHELRHLEQAESGTLPDNEDLEGLSYYTQDHEIDAQTSGLHLRGVLQNRSFENVIRNSVENTMKRQGLTDEEGEKLYTILLKDIIERYGDGSLQESESTQKNTPLNVVGSVVVRTPNIINEEKEIINPPLNMGDIIRVVDVDKETMYKQSAGAGMFRNVGREQLHGSDTFPTTMETYYVMSPRPKTLASSFFLTEPHTPNNYWFITPIKIGNNVDITPIFSNKELVEYVFDHGQSILTSEDKWIMVKKHTSNIHGEIAARQKEIDASGRNITSTRLSEQTKVKLNPRLVKGDEIIIVSSEGVHDYGIPKLYEPYVVVGVWFTNHSEPSYYGIEPVGLTDEERLGHILAGGGRMKPMYIYPKGSSPKLFPHSGREDTWILRPGYGRGELNEQEEPSNSVLKKGNLSLKPIIDNEDISLSLILNPNEILNTLEFGKNHSLKSSHHIYLLYDKTGETQKHENPMVVISHSKIPLLMDEKGGATLIKNNGSHGNLHKLSSHIPSLKKYFKLTYTPNQSIKYGVPFNTDMAANSQSFGESNAFFKLINEIKNGTSQPTTLPNYFGDGFSEYTGYDNRYSSRDVDYGKTIEYSSDGVDIRVSEDYFITDILEAGDDDHYFRLAYDGLSYGQYHDEVDSDELNYMSCWFDVNTTNRILDLMKSYDELDENIVDCGRVDEGDMADFFETYFEKEWDSLSDDFLLTLGDSIGKVRISNLKDYLDDEIFLDWTFDTQNTILIHLNWDSLLYLILNSNANNFNELFSSDMYSLPNELYEVYTDNWDWSDGTEEELSSDMNTFLDSIDDGSFGDVEDKIKNMSDFTTFIKKYNFKKVNSARVGGYYNHNVKYTLSIENRLFYITEFNVNTGEIDFIIEVNEATSNYENSTLSKFENLILSPTLF